MNHRRWPSEEVIITVLTMGVTPTQLTQHPLRVKRNMEKPDQLFSRLIEDDVYIGV